MRLAKFVQFQVIKTQPGEERIYGLSDTGEIWRRSIVDSTWEKIPGPERAEPVNVRDKLFELNEKLVQSSRKLDAVAERVATGDKSLSMEEATKTQLEHDSIIEEIREFMDNG